MHCMFLRHVATTPFSLVHCMYTVPANGWELLNLCKTAKSGNDTMWPRQGRQEVSMALWQGFGAVGEGGAASDVGLSTRANLMQDC